MSPCRTLQWRKPARSSRSRASSSMSSDRSMPSPRSRSGPNISSMRPVPVPRSSSERNGRSDERLADRALDRLVGDMQLADAIPLRGMGPEIILRRRGAGARAPRRAARGRARSSSRSGSSRAISSRANSAAAPASARRKNAQAPSRKRSTRPASARSFRWREMRGCDCRRIWVRSDTVSSASASSTRMRRRVSSPAALRAALSASNCRWAEPLMGNIPSYKDMFIPLSWANQGPAKTSGKLPLGEAA